MATATAVESPKLKPLPEPRFKRPVESKGRYPSGSKLKWQLLTKKRGSFTQEIAAGKEHLASVTNLICQDPIAKVDHPLVDEQDIAALKGKILASDLTVSQLVSAAWASASTFRGSDMQGGANGARIRLAPQKDWAVNQPEQLARVLRTLEGLQTEFNRAQKSGKRISLADLIVLGGCTAVEQAAKNAGQAVKVPFTPGRTDLSQDQADMEPFAVLEPLADGFRNYQNIRHAVSSEVLLANRAQLLTLSTPEMTVLIGGLRVLGAKRRRVHAWGLHAAPRNAEQRLLRESARHAHAVEGDARRERGLRRPRPEDRGRQVDRHAGRLALRLERGTARTGEGICEPGRPEEVRRGLCRGVDKGHEPGQVRRQSAN